MENFSDHLFTTVYDNLEWVVLAAVFFLAIALLPDYHRPRRQALISSTSRNTGSMKRTPDLLAKGFMISVAIIFLKKWVYHLPIVGVVQTKFSVWAVDLHILIIFYMVLVLEIFALVFAWKKWGVIEFGEAKKKRKKKDANSVIGCLPAVIVFIGVFYCIALSSFYNVTLGQFLAQLAAAPLVLLKMCCTGTVVGLFTGFIAGLVIIDSRWKFKAAEPKRRLETLAIPGVLLVAFGIFSFFVFTGKTPVPYASRLYSMNSERDAVEMLEAAPKIHDSTRQYEVFKQIFAAIRTKDTQWSTKVYSQMAESLKTLKNSYYKSALLKEYVEMIIPTGDFRKALDAAYAIDYPKIKIETLLLILKEVPGPERPKWAKQVLDEVVKSVYLLNDWPEKSAGFNEIARVAAESGDKELAESVFRRALEDAILIKTRGTRCATIKNVVAAVTHTGDTPWAAALLRKMVDPVLKIDDEISRIRSLKEIAVHLAQLNDTQGASAVFQISAQEAQQFKQWKWKEGTGMLEEIALAAAGAGDDAMADSIVQLIDNLSIKENTLRKLQDIRANRNPGLKKK